MTTATAPPVEDLQRSVPFTVTRAAEGSDGLTLEGYAATFNSPTRIDSWEGVFDESIKRGAFAKTIRENTPLLQYDHGRHPLIGSIPLGTIRKLSEDSRGLLVQARMTDNWLVQPIRDAISDGAVTGMSFRFSVVRDEWRDKNGNLVKDDELLMMLFDPGNRGPLQRTLKEVRVAELGPVAWPAYADTSVGVRSQELVRSLEDPDTRADFARALFLQETPDGGEQDTRDHDTDAPLEEHPSEESESRTDAPPGDGHPSAESLSRIDPARLRRDAQFRADYLALITKGSSRYDD